MNLKSRGSIILDLCICISITCVLVLCVFSVKKLEVMQRESYFNYVESQEFDIQAHYLGREECEIECIEEDIPPLNS